MLNAMLLGAAVAGAAEVADELTSIKNMGKKATINCVAKMNGFLDMMNDTLEGTAKACGIDMDNEKLVRVINETKAVVEELIEKDMLPTREDAEVLNQGFVTIRKTLFDGISSKVAPEAAPEQ